MQSNHTSIALPPFRRYSRQENLSLNEDSVHSLESNPNSQKNTSQGKDLSEVYQVANQNSKDILVWRRLTFVVLFCTCIILVGTIFYLLNSENSDDDEEVFVLSLRTATRESKQWFAEYNNAMGNLAQLITVSKEDASQFPFIRIPNFELLCRHSRDAFDIHSVAWAPFVLENQRAQWANFTRNENSWYNESRSYIASHKYIADDRFLADNDFQDFIWEGNETFQIEANMTSTGQFAPLWQISPPPTSIRPINYNILEEVYIRDVVPTFLETHDFLTTAAKLRSEGEIWWEPDISSSDSSAHHHTDGPWAWHLSPVYDRLNDVNSQVVGVLTTIIHWDHFLEKMLWFETHGIELVLRNTCNQTYSFLLTNGEVTYVGKGDQYSSQRDDDASTFPISTFSFPTTETVPGHCVYSLSLYKTEDYAQETKSHIPMIVVCVIIGAFSVIAMTLLIYGRYVNQRNNKIVQVAARSDAIIESLFPTQVRDRMFIKENGKRDKKKELTTAKETEHIMPKSDLSSEKIDEKDLMYHGKPIADLFTDTTVLFADIVGFTAWSSKREPIQVFQLLETIFSTFDVIARRRNVFKVETIGDCYIAVAGLPNPCKDHAVVMARFARECMRVMSALVQRLALQLGSDTLQLAMRMGIHSGPVTAGVLRGENSRFQLFGDSMNTAARMEKNGLREKIHLSQETAELLIMAGKASWLTKREDVVDIRASGTVNTYWLELSGRSMHSSDRPDSNCDSSEVQTNGRRSSNGSASSEHEGCHRDPPPQSEPLRGVASERFSC